MMKTEEKKYYIVSAKCGHVGRRKYIIKQFPVTAKDGAEAAKKTRNIPRVKHDKKDAILNVIKVDKEDYLIQIALNNKNEYFRCKNVQDQSRIKDLDSLILEEPKKEIRKTKRESCEYRNRKQLLERIAYDKYSEECALA